MLASSSRLTAISANTGLGYNTPPCQISIERHQHQGNDLYAEADTSTYEPEHHFNNPATGSRRTLKYSQC